MLLRPKVPLRRDESLPAFPRVHTSILRRIVWQSLLVSAVTIVLLSTLSFIVARSVTTQQRLFGQLSSIATSKKDFLEGAMQADRQYVTDLAKNLSGRSFTGLTERALQPLLALDHRTDQPVLGIALFSHTRVPQSAVGDRIPSLLQPVSETLIVPSVDRKEGWDAVYVYVPLHEKNGAVDGYVGVKFSVSAILERLYTDIASDIGESAEITLGEAQGGEVFVVHQSIKNQPLRFYSLGAINDPHLSEVPLTLAVLGQEGVQMTKDERGRSVIVAYRFLPALGWGITVNIQSEEAFAQVVRLGFALALISAALLSLAGLFGFFSARKLTAPLLQLASKIRALRPGNWNFQRSVHTGDEVELLDQVIADLTTRLKTTYDHLEEEVAERTQELRRQYALDRAIVENIEYGVFSVDATGHITDANPAACRLLHLTREACVGKAAVDLLQIHRRKGHFDAQNHPVTICLQKREAFRASPMMHLSLVREDQSMLPVMLMVNPLLQGQQVLGAIVVFLDVAEERQTDYMKSEFISLASHQLRTPLSAMRWYLELLCSDEKCDLTPEQHTYVDEMHKATRRMASLLDTLLRVARLDNGDIVIEREEVDLVETVQRMSEELRSATPDAATVVRSKLPSHPIYLSTDPVLLSIVVQNLVSNAIKYSPKGGAVELRMEEHDGSVDIYVEDHGIGIPTSEQPRVFEKFFRAKNIRHLLAEGSGLGLYLSKRIVESLGGKISFQSSENNGTTFTVTLQKT